MPARIWQRVACSRLFTRALIVVGVLGLVAVAQTQRAVKTAYDVQWRVVLEDGELRLPTERWQGWFTAWGVVSTVLLVTAVLCWRYREQCTTAEGKKLTGHLRRTSASLSIIALTLAAVAACFRWQAAGGAGSGNLTLATVFNLASLATIGAFALLIANFLYVGHGGITRVVRGVFRRQRVNIAIVLLLTFALMFLGDTSGQSVDSIRSWAFYVFGDGGGPSGAGAARLALGLAGVLLFALALYESGVRLARAEWSARAPDPTPLAACAISVTAIGALVFIPSVRIGPGILIAGLILFVLLLLELPDVSRTDRTNPHAHNPTRAERNAPEWIAITPLLALAATSVSAAVEAALSAGLDKNAGLALLPAVVLGLLAILLTRRHPNDPYEIKGFRWIVGVVVVAVISLAVFGLAVLVDSRLFEGAAVWIMAAYGALWFVVLALYAGWLFHRGEPDPQLQKLVPDEPIPSVAAATEERPQKLSVRDWLRTIRSWPRSLVEYIRRLPARIRGSSVPVVLGPVALGGGLSIFIAVHVEPLDAGRLLGVFTLAFVALSFALPILHVAVRATLRMRPPRLLWWFGMNQVPVLTLLILWWVAVGITQTEWAKTATLHDVRLVDRTAAGDDVKAASGPAADLAKFFNEWVAAQDDIRGTEADGPVPLVLVAAHGGGIRAAYWTVLALDCIVGYSAADVRAADLESTDENVKKRIRDQACASTRRNDAEQAAAARRIFMASGVSGGSVGLFAYARQLLETGTLGMSTADKADWIDGALADDFAAPAIGWALFHDVPNRLLGLHPKPGGRCGFKILGVCYEQDRAAVLEDAFDDRWKDPDSPLAQIRRTYDLRFVADTQTSRRAQLVPLLAMNSTLTGGKARAVTSAADLGSWPQADAKSPGTGNDTLPLAGTVEIRDALCETQDIRLSTAALLSARFPYVTPSGRVPSHCGYDGDLHEADTPRTVYCAHDDSTDAVKCEGNYVDGGYTDNSGLFTIVSVWPSLRALIVQHNIYAERLGLRKIAPLIVELDNHYQKSRQPAVPSGGTAAETLIPLATAFGGRSAIETYARAAAYRILPTSCTLTISPALHPGLIAPLGWELSRAARLDLRAGLTNPHPADTNGDAVRNLRTMQFRLSAAKSPNEVIGTPLTACVPPEPCPPSSKPASPPESQSVTERTNACLLREAEALKMAKDLNRP